MIMHSLYIKWVRDLGENKTFLRKLISGGKIVLCFILWLQAWQLALYKPDLHRIFKKDSYSEKGLQVKIYLAWRTFFLGHPCSSTGKESTCSVGDLVLIWSLGWEGPLEKGMITYSSIMAWSIPRTVYPRLSNFTYTFTFNKKANDSWNYKGIVYLRGN